MKIKNFDVMIMLIFIAFILAVMFYKIQTSIDKVATNNFNVAEQIIQIDTIYLKDTFYLTTPDESCEQRMKALQKKLEANINTINRYTKWK